MLLPAVDYLDRDGAARGGAVAFVVVLGIAVLAAFSGSSSINSSTALPGLVDQVSTAPTALGLADPRPSPPAGRPDHQRHRHRHQALHAHQTQLTTGALSTAGTLVEILTGALLCLFTVIFFLLGGRNIWRFVTRSCRARTGHRV